MCTVCLHVVSVVGRDDGCAVSDASVLIYADAYLSVHVCTLSFSISISCAPFLSH